MTKSFIQDLEEKEIKLKEKIIKSQRELIELKKHAKQYIPMELALQKEYSVCSYFDSRTPKTIHCKISLPSCFVGRKVKLILVDKFKLDKQEVKHEKTKKNNP